ncbi:uncharacterized protein BXZ73DRAFT_77304 [Epithele typhae]|uniref:uncharacterized protein n=1 Tax=Epithele typhae TaxID=378194 RepID=UPI002007F5DC|nr:uncharacterized protein BXZ73DRAFT_77304 [Epithele typhae]KAH9933137.1 hypothetical protein BXZ73DRAFT_77304 [Epithele typhae]
MSLSRAFLPALPSSCINFGWSGSGGTAIKHQLDCCRLRQSSSNLTAENVDLTDGAEPYTRTLVTHPDNHLVVRRGRKALFPICRVGVPTAWHRRTASVRKTSASNRKTAANMPRRPGTVGLRVDAVRGIRSVERRQDFAIQHEQ